MHSAEGSGKRNPAETPPRLATSPFASPVLQPFNLEQHPQQLQSDQAESEQEELTLPRNSKIQRWFSGSGVNRVVPAAVGRARQPTDASHVSLHVEVRALGSAAAASRLRFFPAVVQFCLRAIPG